MADTNRKALANNPIGCHQTMSHRIEKAEPKRKQKAKMSMGCPSHIPNKVTSVALKSATKGKIHRTTIKGRAQGAAVPSMRHHIKGRGEAIVQEANAKQSRRAMLGSAVVLQKEVAPEKKKVACQALCLSSNLFTSIVCYQS